MNFYLFIVILLCPLYLILAEDDCQYNKCRWKFAQSSSHSPCMGMGNRGLVRNVECKDGNTIHICCKLPYREDVQKRRQKWFRFVAKTGRLVSSECTKLILCEQSCKDGLEGSARSDYPQVLESDSSETKEYLDAYKKGENQACYQQNDQSNSYDAAGCEADCKVNFPTCAQELDDNYVTDAYYLFSRVGHKFGMWSFSAWWLVQDTVHEAQKKVIEVGVGVKKGFLRLLGRMNKLADSYLDSLEKKEGRSRRSLKTTDESWIKFLTVYNVTDPQLVESVYESLNYEQFSKARETTLEILATYDFGPE